MSYYDNVNQTLLDAVDPSARRICEFGCGAGGMVRAIRSRQTVDYFVGVELAEEQLALAREVLDVALQRNLDQIPDWSSDHEIQSHLPLDSFDLVIFGDVLEHLYNPQHALDQAVLRLKSDGSALICMPNVQHWSVFVQLVLGSWPQADTGLFDRTHIRWFTLNDMINLMQRAGLIVESIQSRIFSPEQGLPFLEDLEPLARNLGINPDVLIERGLPLQYVLVGRKT